MIIFQFVSVQMINVWLLAEFRKKYNSCSDTVQSDNGVSTGELCNLTMVVSTGELGNYCEGQMNHFQRSMNLYHI